MWFWRSREITIPTRERTDRIDHLRDLIREARKEQVYCLSVGCPLTAERAGELLERYWAELRELEGYDALD
jgi:hypothetical protein